MYRHYKYHQNIWNHENQQSWIIFFTFNCLIFPCQNFRCFRFFNFNFFLPYDGRSYGEHCTKSTNIYVCMVFCVYGFFQKKWEMCHMYFEPRPRTIFFLVMEMLSRVHYTRKGSIYAEITLPIPRDVVRFKLAG